MDTKEEVFKTTVIPFLTDHLHKIILVVRQIRIIIRQVTTLGTIQTHRIVDHIALQVEVHTTHQGAVHMVRLQ
jgi:hypothetical protein